jgi:hypothetical protein
MACFIHPTSQPVVGSSVRLPGGFLLCAWICASVVAQDPAENSANSAPELPQAPSAYRPVTGTQRLRWFVRSTVGYSSLTGGLFSAGFGAAINSPHEYGPHWDGFAQRYGMHLTAFSTGNFHGSQPG